MDRLDRLAHYALIFLGVFAFFAALRLTESITAPLVLALVTGIVLSPISSFVERAGFRPWVGAMLSLLLTLIIIGSIAAAIQPMIMQLLEAAPQIWHQMQGVLEAAHRLTSGFRDMSAGITEALQPPAQPNDAGPQAPDVSMPTLTDALFYAPSIAAQILIFIGALFFFQLTRTEIYNWAARRLSEPDHRAHTAFRLLNAERLVARYFLTITVINFIEGVLVGSVMQAAGLPGGALWGFVAFLMNYLLYVGPAVLTAALLVAGVASFSGWMALLPVASYLVINGIEGQFVTPTLVGKHTAVNPLLVFLALVFGMWLWGPVGGIIAIPLLLWFLALNDTRSGQMHPPAH
ncbi:AI-2E family transporter [Falsirhodobacter algicola]|uniref:AI-2E family transporter n=1 Tax=Falsirhodobacter algicola TaxID=2692330 RepID=A0A8J8MSP2_9RHOB|nr:AI-2E family transporter [Falsirhodobacter algicola]QUS36016.1 AI-2E family transporter [Falsirhodobacter algicola]